jgi:hypothetical protein
MSKSITKLRGKDSPTFSVPKEWEEGDALDELVGFLTETSDSYI